MDNKYIINEHFTSHAKRFYLPKDIFYRLDNGMLVDVQDAFVCMAHSQTARDLNLTGNDDGKGTERYHLIKDIKNFFERDSEDPGKDFQERIEPGILRMWDNQVAMKYNQNAKDPVGSPWIWNDEFYCAPLTDLKHIYNLLYNFN